MGALGRRWGRRGEGACGRHHSHTLRACVNPQGVSPHPSQDLRTPTMKKFSPLTTTLLMLLCRAAKLHTLYTPCSRLTLPNLTVQTSRPRQQVHTPPGRSFRPPRTPSAFTSVSLSIHTAADNLRVLRLHGALSAGRPLPSRRLRPSTTSEQCCPRGQRRPSMSDPQSHRVLVVGELHWGMGRARWI